ncbi:uncharacterized protein LOC142774316 [Rhipicephalus microplus]|uniref:uncharacterized protein LOC142774316 n=1 Tax=Rhipicephalus microplus TaxID=6941 RepID=UPI003F6D8A23
MLTLLQDTTTYMPLDRDPTPKVQKDFQRLLADVFRVVPPEGKSLYVTLLCHNSSAPALYGLPKVHKSGAPMRPIVDFTRSPLHNLSVFLHCVISPFEGHHGTQIWNSYDLMHEVCDIVLDENDILVSFDVKSLFTSVPVEVTVDVCRAALESDADLAERSPVDVPNLVRLLRLR